ncbi:MAG: cytochrome c oxidase subunit II [Desulfovibrio sp.]
MKTSIPDAVAQIDTAFIIIFGLSAVILLGITAAVILFVVKYHHTRHPKAADIDGSVLLETLWTVIPTAIVIGLFYFGWTSYATLRTMPENAIHISLEARMWSWDFVYPNGRHASEIVVPVNKPIVIDMTSIDVLHSFYAPAFRIKMDTVPGMTTQAWFAAKREGEYNVFCAEYCGLQHSDMTTVIRAVSQKEYETWLAEGLRDNGLDGLTVLEQYGCTGCHSLDGTELAGPSLLGIFNRPVTVEIDGAVKETVADKEYIIRAIEDPEAELVEGWPAMMPPYELSDDEMNALLEYLKSLK